MLSTFDRASIAVASACAVASNFVKVLSVAPLQVLPSNLFLSTFASIGINDDAHLATFKALLVSLVPAAIQGAVQALGLSTGLQVGLIVNHVDALIAQSEA
jgi:hypothetical protein